MCNEEGEGGGMKEGGRGRYINDERGIELWIGMGGMRH
jgi:hypothetical protein